MHAVVARSTFRSQNVQNTRGSDHFWRLRCRKSTRRCGAKHVSKSKCTKQPCASSPGQVGACDFLVENECCISTQEYPRKSSYRHQTNSRYLEKLQLTRSAFSKLCLDFFLENHPPCLNCIILKLRNQKK